MNKYFLILSTFAAIALIGCGDDSSSSGKAKVSCLVKDGDANSYCVTAKFSEEECTTSEENDGWGGTVVDACPEGAVQTCTLYGEDYSIYNADMNWLCEE